MSVKTLLTKCQNLRALQYFEPAKISKRFIRTSEESRAPIHSAILANETEIIKVKFSDGAEHDYPWIYLQDNCTCPKCFHASSQSRKRLMTNLDLDKKILTAVIEGGAGNSDAIRCTWLDGHEGIFSEKWLLDRRFSQDNIQERTTVLRDEVELIHSDYEIESDQFESVIQEPLRLLKMLRILAKYGVFILKGAETHIGQLRDLVDKIGFIRTTHYGAEFTVKSERNASNMAYTADALCVHTDLPYYVYPPGVQLLHCIKQYQYDDGGHTNLVDGFLVAQHMRQKFPEQYQILRSTPVEFADVGEDFTKFNKVHHSPTFVHCTKSGKLTRIVYSNQQLSSFLPIPLEKVRPLYGALKLFTTMCYKPTNLIRFKLNEGDILVFDNWRFLHGREAFDPSKGDRYLEGCYVDWDEIYSTIRVLSETETKS